MQVIVRDRNQGKTTLLIEWLLKGHIQNGYPGWSRVIVTPTTRNVPLVARQLDRYMRERPVEFGEHWICEHSHPHVHVDDEKSSAHQHTSLQLLKSVWSLRDLAHNMTGAGPFEYALDDADMLFTRMQSIYLLKQPTLITMTGELYEDVRNRPGTTHGHIL